MCEEYESFHERTGRLVVMVQSIVLSAIKAEVSSENDDPTHQNFLLQQFEERIEKLSQQEKLSKFCMDAGFLSVVQNGQYFMTEDNGKQFYAKACRQYTLPRDLNTTHQMMCFRGAKVCTKCPQEKVMMMILLDQKMRIWTRNGKDRIVQSLMTRHDADANDTISDCATLH